MNGRSAPSQYAFGPTATNGCPSRVSLVPLRTTQLDGVGCARSAGEATVKLAAVGLARHEDVLR